MNEWTIMNKEYEEKGKIFMKRKNNSYIRVQVREGFQLKLSDDGISSK